MAGSVQARLIACLLTVVGVAGGYALRVGAPTPDDETRLTEVPRVLGARTGRDVEISERVRAQLRSDALLLRSYEAEAESPVWVFVDYHRQQRLGATVHSPRICYPGAGWSIDGMETAVVTGATETWPARWLDLSRGGETMVALYWYETRWGRSSREIGLKANIVRSAFARRVSDAALVRWSSPVIEGDRDAARERILDFMGTAVGAIRDELPFGETGS